MRRASAVFSVVVLLVVLGGVSEAVPLQTATLVDGWVILCPGSGEPFLTSAPLTFPRTIYIRRSYTHVEAPQGTGYNVWIAVLNTSMWFGAMNEWVSGWTDRMEWRTARESYAPDWIVVPAGAQLAVRANCGWGTHINTLVAIWYTESMP